MNECNPFVGLLSSLKGSTERLLADGNVPLDLNYLPLTGGMMTGFIDFDGDNGASWTLPNGITYSIRTHSPTGVFQLVKEKQGSVVSAITFHEVGSFAITASDFKSEIDLYGTVSGSLVWDKKEVERVNSNGTNYTRYDSGLQICWGSSSTPSGHSSVATFPVPFRDLNYRIVATASIEDSFAPYMNTPVGILFEHKTKSSALFRCVMEASPAVDWIAIGYWR